jgi:hypothetical protein
MVNLEELQQEIATLGEKIKALKASGDAADNKDAVATAVASLLQAKKTYAENNNGIGYDGQPHEEPLTKAQKKAKVKAEADQLAAAASSGKQVRSIYMRVVSLQCSCDARSRVSWATAFEYDL